MILLWWMLTQKWVQSFKDCISWKFCSSEFVQISSWLARKVILYLSFTCCQHVGKILAKCPIVENFQKLCCFTAFCLTQTQILQYKTGIWTVKWLFYYTSIMFNTRCYKKWLFLIGLRWLCSRVVYVEWPIFAVDARRRRLHWIRD